VDSLQCPPHLFNIITVHRWSKIYHMMVRIHVFSFLCFLYVHIKYITKTYSLSKSSQNCNSQINNVNLRSKCQLSVDANNWGFNTFRLLLVQTLCGQLLPGRQSVLPVINCSLTVFSYLWLEILWWATVHHSPLTCTVLQDAIFLTKTGTVYSEKCCLLPQQQNLSWFSAPTFFWLNRK